ncbi:MAG TPA: HEAT repeat domain-containing protein [Methanocorpusculum sp.]|nr:HEAT repeat domain-containing protein [Methanocorpusculum sp.]
MNERTFTRLVGDLESPDFSKVESAATTLSALRDESARAWIDATLKTSSPLVQRVMLWALQNYQISDYAPYTAYLISPDANVREACQVLFMAGGIAGVKALESAAKNENAEMQYAIASVLGLIRTPAAAFVLQGMLDAEDAGVRSGVASALSAYSDGGTTAALCAHLGDAESDVVLSLLYSLRDRDLSTEQIGLVLPLIASPSAEIRAACVHVLDAVTPDTVGADASPKVRRAFAERTASAKLLEKLCSDPDASVRTAAAGSAAKHHLVFTDLFISMMADENPGVRRAAAEALGSVGSADAARAVPVLTEALHDKRPGIRVSAVNALASIGGPEAKAALEAAQAEKIPLLSGIIKNALTKFDT